MVRLVAAGVWATVGCQSAAAFDKSFGLAIATSVTNLPRFNQSNVLQVSFLKLLGGVLSNEYGVGASVFG